jgi:hypothetical protein
MASGAGFFQGLYYSFRDGASQGVSELLNGVSLGISVPITADGAWK